MGGMKDNVGKEPLSHLSRLWPALNELAKVTEFGAKKYEEDNYLDGIDPRLLYDAAMRHIFKAMNGEVRDQESELDHLAHAAWNCLALLTYRKLGMPNMIGKKKIFQIGETYSTDDELDYVTASVFSEDFHTLNAELAEAE